MKKKGIKRALAFLLAVVFAFSTCMTAGPYTVQATEAGQTGSGEEEAGGGTTPDQGGTVDEKLSVNVVNRASIPAGPGFVDGVKVALEYNEKNEDIMIGESQLDMPVSTDVSYDEFVADANRTITVSDVKGLYQVEAAASVDMEKKSLNVTITKVTVNAEITGTDSGIVYAEEAPIFSVTDAWKDYVTWEIEEGSNTAEAYIVSDKPKDKCAIRARDGRNTSYTIVIKSGTVEIARKTVNVDRKETQLSIATEGRKSWFNQNIKFTLTLRTKDGIPVAGRIINYTYDEGKQQRQGECEQSTNGDGQTTLSIKLSRYQKDVNMTGYFVDTNDKVYKGSTKTVTYNPDKEKADLTFSSNCTKKDPLEVTYGTEDIELTVGKEHNGQKLQGESFNSLEVSYKSSDGIDVKTDTTGKIIITPKKASSDNVVVTLKGETDNYTFEKTIYVKVKPYPLIIKSDSVTVSASDREDFSGKKIYDGTKTVDVKATLVDAKEQNVTPTANTIAQIGKFEAAVFKGYDSGLKDVLGEEESQNMTFAPEDLSTVVFADTTLTEEDKESLKNNYKIQKAKDDITVPLTIQKRMLKLSVEGTSRGFRDLDYAKPLDKLVFVNATTGETGFVTGEGTDLKGFKFPNVVDKTATGLNAENVKTQDSASYGVHEGALQLRADDQTNPTNNYKFDLSDYTSGNVTITEEKNAAGYVEIKNSTSIHAYQAGDKRYYGEQATVKLQDKDGYYDHIYYVNGEKNEDITTSGLGLGDEHNNINRSFYMTKEGISGEIIAKTKEFSLDFEYDAEAPTCVTTLDTDDNIVRTLETSITFGIYKNHAIEAKVKLSDTQSGVNGMSYFIAKTDAEKEKYEDLLTKDDYAEALAEEQFTDAGKPDENNTWTIKNIGKLEGEDKLDPNNYIIFVKAKDNVGNVMIYGSNGIVLENMHDISVTYTETEGAGVISNEWRDVTYYSGDAKLNLTAKEGASDPKFYSGLEQMGYQISYMDGDGKTGEDKEVIISNKYPEGVTLKKLTDYRTITTSPDIVFKNDPTKSRVITVTAPKEDTKDNAGNTMEADAVHTLVLDSVSPAVTSTWMQENNGGKFLHEKYANSNVTYKVTVQERFLKDLTVTINGTAYTLDQLEAKKDTLGIGTITKDEDADITKTTDNTLYHFTLVFNKDGNYNVKTTATDAATNTKSDNDNGFAFTIDTVAPELEVTYTAYNKNQTTSLLDPSKGRAYANEAVDYITATAVMTERNFSAENVVAVVKAVNSQNADVSVADYAAAIKNKWNDLGEVSGSDNRHRYTITLPVINIDANYDFTYDYTDLAGNPLKATVKQAVTLDRVRPEGIVTVEDLVNGSISQVWNKLLNTITFGYFGKNSVRASMTSEDETAGVAITQYLVSQKALSRADLEKRTDWTGYSAKISLAANQHLVVYEKVADKAGNIEFFSTDGIIVDNTNPTPTVTITPTTPAWGKGVYSAGDNPGFDVRVEDPLVNDAYSGLKTITYRIVNGTTGYTESGTLANLAQETHQQIWTGHVNINPNQFYSNDVQVSVYAEDWSTNSATSQTATLKVDNKAPIVSFSFDKSDVHNGKYYKNDKTLTITVDERNFDPSYMPRVTSTTGGGYSISGWSHNGEIHTATVTFSGDSDYTVSYDCYDLAGNKSNTENLEEFTVDKTVPVIKVSYNNNSALNGNYYKAARTATITVTEHNFDPSKITVSTTASAGGAPGVSGWSNNGDAHTANVVFNHDADYTFTVSGFDLAENKAADYAQDKFTVDLKNPEVKITGVKDKSANNGTVAPHISISDTNFITSGVKVTLKGANRGDVKIDSLANITSSATGMNVIFKDFPEGMDDIYTLTAKVTDKAGNETTSSITFSVNRDGSTYEIGSSTKALIDKKYTNKPQDLEITEINVDDLTTIEITYSLDGKVVTLKEGEDYTITKSGEDGQWKKYVYKIKASCFEKEGNYVINIYSEDAAHNSTTNKTKAKTIEFTVDKTAPTMVVSNLADRGRYKENTHEFTLNVKDNIYLAYVEVYLDGELFKRFEEDEIAQLNGELLVDIASSNQYQTIELVSCDKAGNISKEVYDPETNEQVPASYKVLVTQNSFVQFINNTPLLISVIVIFVAIVVLIIVLVKRKKDKQK